MANSRAGEVALKSGSSPKCKWIFTKEEMKNMASLREGLDEFKELQLRQQSTKFIQLLGDRLNQNLRDHRGKISQLCMCAAMIHMHRFFYFHSFTFFDYRDVAAACLFMSGKSEECPRKIDHIVRAWWNEKFPGIKIDQEKYDNAMGLLVAIESLILQTIAFDLKVALPHPLVLQAMHAIAKNNRKITEVVYFFSTDVLCVTSWGIRYSAEAIAVACVHIVCTWANFEMPPSEGGTKWYHKMDPTMTEDQLNEMMIEFIKVYKTCKNELAITKFIKKGEIRNPISDADDRATPPALMADDMRLPPPPPPPLSLASKKVDINAYKERRATEGSSSGSAAHHGQHSQQPQQRRSFMPEMAKGVTASMPGFVPPKQEPPADVKPDRAGLDWTRETTGGDRNQTDRKPDWIKQEPVDRKPEFSREDAHRSSSSSQQRPSRPPSNGSSSQQLQQSSRSSSGGGGHQYPYMHQQQPSGSGDRGMERSMMSGDRGRDGDRERGEKRKRESSSSNLNSDKRARPDMAMQQGGPPPQQQRGHSMMPQQQQVQQPQHGYNSVPPPLMQQTQPHFGSSSKVGEASLGFFRRH
ncbi:cit-1.1 [Pristionchus pacificus]|uniref:Cit-1.2 n=1 Tax=Pristionchus pacificus TaxID=54126 RepID=A0A2A6CCT3_PRIPA|nr:cit-1.1 [Pristionchus pacificus]|eukprot:PDM76012.1 cit-1.2 [Pristionchus pacificus]